MKTLIDRIDRFIYRVKKLNRLIDSKTSVQGVVKSVLGALLLSVLVLAPIILIIVNMFIYTKLTFLLSIFLVVTVMGWGFLYYFFYYRLLRNYFPVIEDIDTMTPQLFESSILAFVFLIIGFVVLTTVF
jgi:Kef-type K+ transport system membrane component KefB